ncbi:MAG: sulfatase [Myxococcales bacterium]|nr:sulfatase [Myxococcales bacterium]
MRKRHSRGARPHSDEVTLDPARPRRGRAALGSALAAALVALSALPGCSRSEASVAKPGAPASGASPSSAPPAPVAALADAAAAAPSPARPRNVLLISVDSLRSDMPWAGYPRAIAPRLTAFEAQSVSYTHAYAISSYTSMSLGGLLAGRYPHELSRDGYFFGKYAASNQFFPELLQAAHVHTASAHAHGYFEGAGFEQGFDVWKILPNLKWNAKADENVTSPAHEQLAEELLTAAAARAQSGRFFAWFHFLDPHDNYQDHTADGVEPFGKRARDRYDGEVLFTDRYVGKLLDFVEAAPWGKDTVVVVTSDHGEAFGEHGQTRHGFEIWENLVRVPLMVRAPGARPRRIDEPRSAIDLAPTFLDLLGVKGAETLPGKSLVPELLGGPAVARDVVVDLPATSDNDRRRAVVSGKWKMVAYGAQQLYFNLFDLEADPGELSPILKGDDFERMRARYKEATAGIKDVPATRCGKGCLEGSK